MKDRKTILWILAFALLCLLSAAALLWMGRDKPPAQVALITVDGELWERIELDRVTESYDLLIDTPYGQNLVHVEPGAISVTEADCPDRVCASMGKLEPGGLPIVCMPHHLVIELEARDTDA